MGSRAAGTQSGILIWDTGIARGGLNPFTTMMTPYCIVSDYDKPVAEIKRALGVAKALCLPVVP